MYIFLERESIDYWVLGLHDFAQPLLQSDSLSWLHIKIIRAAFENNEWLLTGTVESEYP